VAPSLRSRLAALLLWISTAAANAENTMTTTVVKKTAGLEVWIIARMFALSACHCPQL
jgi:hypothetical protein